MSDIIKCIPISAWKTSSPKTRNNSSRSKSKTLDLSEIVQQSNCQPSRHKEHSKVDLVPKKNKQIRQNKTSKKLHYGENKYLVLDETDCESAESLVEIADESAISHSPDIDEL